MRHFVVVFAILMAGPHLDAVEGKMPKAIEDKGNKEQINFVLAGAKAGDFCKSFNEKRVAKIGIDPKLAKTTFKELRFDGMTLSQAIDKLADEVKGKSYVLRDFYYIGASLPAGVKVATGDGKDQSVPGMLSTLPVEFSGVQPGQYRSIPFINQTPAECREEMEPVLLYVHDDSILENNPKAIWFETFVFEDPKIKAALKDFNCVMLDSKNKDWPATIHAPAKGGFAVYLMTCDMQVKAMFTHKQYNVPMPHFLGAIKTTLNANASVKKRVGKILAKGKEKGKKPPEEEEAFGQENKENRKTGISILDKKKDDKKDDKKPVTPEKPVVEEEE